MKIKFILGVSLLTTILAAALIASTSTYLNANAQNTTTQQTPPQQLQQQNQTMSGQSSIANDIGVDEGAGEDKNEAGDNDTNDKEDSP